MTRDPSDGSVREKMGTMTKTVEDLKIDPRALYTTEQAARMLMELKPDKSFEEALKIVEDATGKGELKVAGYLTR